MRTLEAWMAQREEKKRRYKHPLPDPLTEEQWATIREAFSFPPRQLQVVRYLCRACTDREIAEQIGIDFDTVRMHVRAALARLNVRNRVGVLTKVARVVCNDGNADAQTYSNECAEDGGTDKLD